MEGLKRIEQFLDVRAGEALSFWRRKERVFDSGGHWYFRTREGIDVGPYRTRFEAEVESEVLKQQLQDAAQDCSPEVVRAFMLESASTGMIGANRRQDDGLRAHWHADIGVLS